MDELSSLALKHGTDKYGHHFYTPIYYNYLKDLKDLPLNILEIGIGGYHLANQGGGGLRMWAEFFKKSKITGIDIYDKGFLDGGNIQTFVLSQTDEDGLSTLISHIGSPNIIIDDGSHINSHVIKSFKILFPLLKEGGFYFVEDCHTSYWDELASDGVDFGGGIHPNTTMNFFKSLVDSVNYEHTRVGRESLLTTIEFISFHKELICIKKL